MKTRFSGGLAFLLCVVALGFGSADAGAAPSSAGTIAAANALENAVLAELNGIRRAHGLAPLRLAPALGAAADFHSRTMGRYGYFGHQSRDGSDFGKRVKRFYGAAGYGAWSVGENLLWSSGSVDAAKALQLWMNSPGHRANILTPRWREIGVSIVTVQQAPGIYGNRTVTIMTTDFGARS
jgi:uncharacterized protein YkwD